MEKIKAQLDMSTFMEMASILMKLYLQIEMTFDASIGNTIRK